MRSTPSMRARCSNTSSGSSAATATRPRTSCRRRCCGRGGMPRRCPARTRDRGFFTVARRLVVDGYRRRSRRPRAVASEAVMVSMPGPDELEGALLAWEIGEALRTLSPEHRRVLLEVHYRDRPVAEAAAVLGIPEGTMRSRVFYALRAVRLALEERG
jgi:hypothetical protein